jgi:hypothetical protein
VTGRLALLAFSLVIATGAEALDLGARVGVGATLLDGDLRDHGWNVEPRTSVEVGATLTPGVVRMTAGMSFVSTTQESGIPGDELPPSVRLTGGSASLDLRAFGLAGFEAWPGLRVGLLHLGWDPDHITYDLPGLGAPLEVRYEAVTEPTYGVGLAVERSLTPSWRLGAMADRAWFGLDVARREGDDVHVRRETFGTWSVRLAVTWHPGRS